MLFNVKSINAASDVAGRDVVIYMTALDGRRFDYAGRQYIVRKHLADFNAGIMPGQGEDQSKQRESKVQHKEFGWLSPEGTFTESPFGTHEESAEMICERKGFVDEYWKWVKENGDNEIGHLMRDFLSEVKGYCLIHNPTGCGGYIVTNMKSLTKRQKEFLYGYFMDMGDRFKAEQFIKE